jgi:ATP-dependent DNA helicase RecG
VIYIKLFIADSIDIIKQNKFVTIPELSKSLKISTTAIENNLAKLKQRKILKRVGPDKGGKH